jgi:iron complex transport system substrate-binding protein
VTFGRKVLAALAALAPLTAAAAEAPPARIASLNLSADEMLVELVATDRLVTVTTFADDPEMSNIVGRVPPGVVRVTRAKMERLVELRPDLVVVSEFTEADFLHLLTTSKMKYHRVEVPSLDSVPAAILGLGKAVGADAAAAKVAEGHRRALSDLDHTLAGVKRPRVLYWMEPYTAGRDTVMSDILTRAGAVNLALELGVVGFAPLPAERGFAANPDWVVVRKEGTARTALLAHPVLSRLPAVREGRIVEVPGRLLSTLSHHTADAARLIARALHPDRFPKENP